ncbi:cardiolipin synthase [Candidatus Thiothrix sp. Deng01]|uniref:Cardiolipin synthase n=1 Tax=Candidatus Thiothrix phosphatis TaxID=3112415 RepID=A0ABU6CWI4_9GAMM|nr:cardiolipin synthase [Candidatus Thiothrix sp. Deng01]MEB4590479.1 cardiolipin synthase [Candidatus Thiothrix sp. Deng01]
MPSALKALPDFLPAYLGGALNTGLLLLDILIIAVLLPTVVQQRRESGATLAWVLVIVLLPFIGLLAFWLLGSTRLHLRRRKRRKVEEKLSQALDRLQTGPSGESRINGVSPSLLKLARALDDVGPLAGNAADIMRDGKTVFAALEQAFAAAEHHIHLVYYIWEPDYTGGRMRDALIRAAQRGVEVRLLVDDVGSRQAGRRFFAPLRAAGGRVERFLKVSFFSRRLNLNNRNHRKLVVIDGRLAFTGGMNVGDVYAGRGEPWEDLHACLQGPVVCALQEVFCQDWYHATNENLVSEAYFPVIAETGDICAQFLASGPADERWQAIHTLLFAAMNLASGRIWIETPYFVPDRPILLALQTAALRGVDVRLLLPGRSDHPLVLYAGRSFVDELLLAGVRVFEMHRVMPHAKAVMIDGDFATLGSANMDQRSFRLNFEGNVFFYGSEIAGKLEQDFLALCQNAQEVTVQQRKYLPKNRRLAENIARLLSPLL